MRMVAVLKYVPERYDIKSFRFQVVHLLEVIHAVVEHLKGENPLFMVFLN